ncbi:allantoate deiminase [Chitinophaga sp. CF118]|uniref:M20 family metallo-hydrolase n=1 Tax=Chitinophaga sp. CF118 TaxID=1884367 RepID=UPI0008E9B879|nr:M20 family metallo-hydrolase [Chitinophaga sp. CF118]SFD60794.1 allantoate deiminase [Chitinophaga sp. CF118]
MSYLQRAEGVLHRIQALAAISDDAHGITRTFGSAAFMAGSKQVLHWMQEAGLQVRVDNIGNVRGRWNCGDIKAKTFVIASHIDTVINAGAFDGPLGVLAALDIVTHLLQSAQPVPFNIEVIAFSDEEGVRFHTTFLGSKTVTGSFDHHLHDKKDAAGITLKEVIGTMGGNTTELYQDVIPPASWQGYFEIHIEQGPVLYDRNIPVAVVHAIAGQQRIMVTIKGMAGHAGTVPMDKRQDALCGAAAFILAVEQWALQHKDAIVATVGYLQVMNAASNVIPGEVTLSLDLRSANENMLHNAHTALYTIGVELCKERQLIFEWQTIQQTKPVDCDPFMSGLLEQSITEAGYDAIRLVSGAGHDAVPVSDVSPVCMLFVKCYKGISHHPQENVLLEDIAAALKVSDQFMLHLIKQP